MAARISFCPYRLLFKHPFGTAHGMRDGTDAVFIRIEEKGCIGYGEVTLPPYVEETIAGAIELIRGIGDNELSAEAMLRFVLSNPVALDHAPGCRAGIQTALVDLLAQQQQLPAREFLGLRGTKVPMTLMTVGISPLDELEQKLRELPASGALKVKVGDPDASSRIQRIMQLDNRRLFLDGNQGLASVEDAQALIDRAGVDRMIGFEQPFGMQHDDLNETLSARTRVVVYGDESIQSLKDLVAKPGLFGGVNVKLMKCGGLDRATDIVRAARDVGMHVMLGSMSESSLGCTAMAQLAAEADIVDLDGPWLIKNDPFAGIGMDQGRLYVPSGPGLAVRLVADLEFVVIGA